MMNFKFWDTGLKDERLVNTRNRLYKEAYNIAVVLCAISIVWKFILYGTHFDRVYTELAVLVIPSLYYTFRYVRLGLYRDEVEHHDRTHKQSWSVKNIIIALLAGVIMAVVFGVHSAVAYGNGVRQQLWYFFIVFVACLMFYCPFMAVIFTLTDVGARKASPKPIDEDQDD